MMFQIVVVRTAPVVRPRKTCQNTVCWLALPGVVPKNLQEKTKKFIRQYITGYMFKLLQFQYRLY